MESTTSSSSIPQISALQETFLPPSPSQEDGQDQDQDQNQNQHAPHLTNLALQVLHNLQHQHRWTDLRIHTHCSHIPSSTSTIAPPPPPPLSQTQNESGTEGRREKKQKKQEKKQKKQLLPRPLISGLPPQRLYIHPDEQIALLQTARRAAAAAADAKDAGADAGANAEEQQQGRGGGGGLDSVEPEREWVCPSQLREKWTLRRFGDVFDRITLLPPSPLPPSSSASASSASEDGGDEKDDEEDDDDDDEEEEEQEQELEQEQGIKNKWRTAKRVLLATVDDDSTIVYYIVHDGIVKPRQN